MISLEMRMKNPIPQFSQLVRELATQHPNLAYLHAVEARVDGHKEIELIQTTDSLDFIREIWRPTDRPFLVAGGFTPESALENMSKPEYENDMIVFGRLFLANVRVSGVYGVYKLTRFIARFTDSHPETDSAESI